MIENWGSEKRVDLLLNNTPKSDSTALVWVSQLPAVIRKEFIKFKRYLPETRKLRVAYQKPDTIQKLVSKPRSLEREVSSSSACGHCKLCGKHGKGISMVDTVSKLKVKIQNKTKTFAITSSLNCKKAGIYVAICTNCDDTYVGQTTTEFRTRLANHRFKWVDGAATNFKNRDETALLDHYRANHSEIYKQWCHQYPKSDKQQHGFDHAFKLVFVDKVGLNLLEQEDIWQTKLKSKINRQKILTPAVTN